MKGTRVRRCKGRRAKGQGRGQGVVGSGCGQVLGVVRSRVGRV